MHLLTHTELNSKTAELEIAKGYVELLTASLAEAKVVLRVVL